MNLISCKRGLRCNILLSGHVDNFLCLADIFKQLEKTATFICSLIFDPHFLNYSEKDKSAVLHLIPRILHCILLLFNSANITLSEKHLQTIAEVAYLPWVDSIDPPWFDWQPRIHNARELRAIGCNLKSMMEKEVTPGAIKLVLQLPSADHVSWKIHIFRSAIVSPVLFSILG